MKVGLIGLEGAGKRTLFNLLTGITIDAEQTMLKTYIGMITVPDERVDQLALMSKSKVKTFSKIEVYLIPSIKTDSDQTKKSLADAKFMDIFGIVVREFKDDSVYHPLGNINPKRDYNLIRDELILTDLMLVELRLDRIASQLKTKKDTVILAEQNILEKFKSTLEQGKFLSELTLTKDENKLIRSLNFLTQKPIFAIINCGEDKIQEKFDLGCENLNISVKIEQEIQSLDTNGKQEFLQTLGLNEPSVNRLIKFAYNFGNLISFLTTGEKESRAWTIHKGDTAQVSAGAIHSDIEKGFIRAEVIHFEDLKKAGSETEAKRLGLFRLEGKEYIVKDGDCIEFRFSKP